MNEVNTNMHSQNCASNFYFYTATLYEDGSGVIFAARSSICVRKNREPLIRRVITPSPTSIPRFIAASR